MALQKETIYVGVIGLLAGVIIAGAATVLTVNSGNKEMMGVMGIDTSRIKDTSADHMGMPMSDMQSTLVGKTGDDFDENFLAMMITHHQGAVNMAKLSEQNAKHEELKSLSRDILSTQSKEIDLMQTWQTNWGYKVTPKSHMMSR